MAEARKMPTEWNSSEGFAWLGSRALTLLLAMVLISAIFSSYSVISPGNSGVVFNIWTGSLRTVGQGMIWRLPWITRVQSYPTALRTYNHGDAGRGGFFNQRRQH